MRLLVGKPHGIATGAEQAVRQNDRPLRRLRARHPDARDNDGKRHGLAARNRLDERGRAAGERSDAGCERGEIADEQDAHCKRREPNEVVVDEVRDDVSLSHD